jgi:hypothetical protein
LSAAPPASVVSDNVGPHYDATEAPITCVAVPPGEVAPDHAGLLAMSAVVGAVQGEAAQRGEPGLDPVEPAGAGRRVGQLDVVRCGPVADPGSSRVDRCGLKLSSTIAILVVDGYKVRR